VFFVFLLLGTCHYPQVIYSRLWVWGGLWVVAVLVVRIIVVSECASFCLLETREGSKVPLAFYVAFFKERAHLHQTCSVYAAFRLCTSLFSEAPDVFVAGLRSSGA